MSQLTGVNSKSHGGMSAFDSIQLISFTRVPVTGDHWCRTSNLIKCTDKRIIIGWDRRPETKQGIEGKIVSFRSGGL